jgi:drug/metabolite transporter (DMT)-like permease
LFRNRGALLLLLAAALVSADGLWIAREAAQAPAPRPFQAATGGVGLSAAVSVSWSFFAFDPRLESTCENELWPVPGLTCPNPIHGATLLDPPPRDQLAE